MIIKLNHHSLIISKIMYVNTLPGNDFFCNDRSVKITFIDSGDGTNNNNNVFKIRLFGYKIWVVESHHVT